MKWQFLALSSIDVIVSFAGRHRTSPETMDGPKNLNRQCEAFPGQGTRALGLPSGTILWFSHKLPGR
jgi:hypothetical protein